MLRVLTVDDSAFMRKLVGQMVEESGLAKVVAIARNGQDALDKLEKVQVDLVTLDIEMPVMDGLEALEIIQRDYDIPVIILSGYGRDIGLRTMDALEIGAVDFIQKTSLQDADGVAGMSRALKEKLAAVLALEEDRVAPQTPSGPGPGRDKDKTQTKKGARQKEAARQSPSAEARPAQPASDFSLPKSLTQDCWQAGRPRALAIATSTGGPKVLMEIASGLKGVPDFPVLVVQHMPPVFTASLAQRLDDHCSMRVLEGAEGMLVERGTMYLAPGDYHMRLVDGRLRLDQADKIHGVRPAADYLFESAAAEYGSGLLAFILTGMGKDGAKGLGQVKKKGGYVVAQDQATSTVYGMPKAAVQAGVVDQILPLDGIITCLNKLI